MKLNTEGFDLIKAFEGLELEAYLDSASIWTIGYGNTTYENGTRVKKGDKITLERAEQLFKYFATRFAAQVDSKITVPIGQNQFNTLVSLAYNIGIGAFTSSTILKKVNACPTDPTIRNEFARWKYSGGHVVDGLVKRRKKEADIYFTKN